MDTTEYNNDAPASDYFKTYPDFKSFMADYVSNLVNNPRYINGGVFQATSPEDQIRRMVAAGYSTKSPSAYLKTGVQDRINATRELFPFGQVTSSDVARTLSADDWSICQVLGVNNICN